MERTAGARRLGRLAACLLVGALAAACGGDDGDAASTTAAEATTTSAAADDVCADKDELESSVKALKDVDVVADGTSGLTAAMDAVRSDLSALKSTASAAVQPEVEALEEAFDDLKTAVGDLTDSPSLADAEGAGTAVTAVGTAGEALIEALESDASCG